MKRRLYLHIGAHRTATTSTQKFLSQNFARLHPLGYLQAYGIPRHFELINAMFSGRKDASEVAADLDTRAERRGVQAVILSDEDACMRDSFAPLAGLADRFDVRVVFVMRRQDLWIESWYRQNVKWQWNAALSHLDFDAFLARRAEFAWIDYAATLRRVEEVFGPEAPVPLVFEDLQMPDGPIAAFCAAIGLTDLTGLDPVSVHNKAPSPLMAEYMRHLPLDEMPGPTRSLMERACLKADWYVKRTYGPQSGLYMDAPTRAALMADYATGNAEVARRHFGRDTLFLEPLPAPDAPLAPRHLPGDSTEVLREFAAPMLRAVSQLIAEAEEQRRQAAPQQARRAGSPAGRRVTPES